MSRCEKHETGKHSTVLFTSSESCNTMADEGLARVHRHCHSALGWQRCVGLVCQVGGCLRPGLLQPCTQLAAPGQRACQAGPFRQLPTALKFVSTEAPCGLPGGAGPLRRAAAAAAAQAARAAGGGARARAPRPRPRARRAAGAPKLSIMQYPTIYHSTALVILHTSCKPLGGMACACGGAWHRLPRLGNRQAASVLL